MTRQKNKYQREREREKKELLESLKRIGITFEELTTEKFMTSTEIYLLPTDDFPEGIYLDWLTVQTLRTFYKAVCERENGAEFFEKHVMSDIFKFLKLVTEDMWKCVRHANDPRKYDDDGNCLGMPRDYLGGYTWKEIKFQQVAENFFYSPILRR